MVLEMIYFYVFTLNIVLSSSGKTTPTKFPELPGLREESELRRVILTETPRPVERFVGESCVELERERGREVREEEGEGERGRGRESKEGRREREREE